MRITSSCVTASSTAASSISSNWATIAASRSTGRSRIASACGSRSRSPGVKQSLNDAPASGGLERRRQRYGERLVELDLNACRMTILDVHGKLHAPAADSALNARTNAPFGLGKRLRHAKLQIEMAMVDGADRSP